WAAPRPSASVRARVSARPCVTPVTMRVTYYPARENSTAGRLAEGLPWLGLLVYNRSSARREGGADSPPTRAKPIGLAIVGGGRIGQIRGEIAARHPSVGWLGLAEIRADHAKEVAARVGADFVTTDHRELLARPEVTAAVIATDEHLHVDPILAA